MLSLYIDPGTGSMLFAILIGIIGALRYVVKVGLVKLRFFFSTGKKKTEIDKNRIPFAIFSDDKRYWPVFRPICREFNNRGIDIVYMTASKDDPALNCEFKHVKGQFIGEGNVAFAKLNFLKADILLSTTPGLDVYQWKKSKDVKCYIHIPHQAAEVVLYRMFGIDHYDTILISGQYMKENVRELEKKWSLQEKEIYSVGIPYMDDMLARLNNCKSINDEANNARTVLIAPSWGPSSIFNTYGTRLIDGIIETGYHVIIRPHPQSFKSEIELMNELQKKYPENQNLEWNRDVDNFDVLKRADILISDFSAVIFDFSLVYNKPVIYTSVTLDKSPYDAFWLEEELWTLNILPRIGTALTENNFERIKEIIDDCIENPIFAEGRDIARSETWEHMGEGAKRTVDYMVGKYEGDK